MSLFRKRCKHHWSETKRTKVSSKGFSADSITSDLARDLAFGYEIVEMTCDNCGWIKSIKIQ